jgi:hypothetical protein
MLISDLRITILELFNVCHPEQSEGSSKSGLFCGSSVAEDASFHSA